ncbi:DUF6734 family protein [Ascidiimonas sp. W6]|uniref:DUF6734 family protein n=1 Tax=Ascidiimonas meishanensis TaxID=3128903 RepID=UPI0030EC6095
MKIVQSYWSKPSQKKKELNQFDRNSGGWLDVKYYYYSWVLSCLQFNKYYDKVELVTDKQGYDLLINKLNLPYTNVTVALDAINDYHPDLWALGKIYAYGIQNEPFLHVDGDIYIWDKFDERIERGSLVCQNIEQIIEYNKYFNQLCSKFNFIPLELHKSRNHNTVIKVANAGILGGTDIAFLKEYVNKAFQFVDKNRDKLNKLDDLGYFNMIFEQFLFFALSEEKKKEVTCLLPKETGTFDGLADFFGVPTRTKYIHTLGFYKRREMVCDLLELKLQEDYPDYYYLIKKLIYTYEI